MPRSVIVYGPQQCGKTRNKEALRQRLGLQTVVEYDEMALSEKRALRGQGVLYLTNASKDQAYGIAARSEHDIIVIAFDKAMKS
ncbi:hypothetical protein ACUBIP_26235 [Escherichia coli]|uniref:hypothetical protein n=1 Tax=Escherichia coli TaxID=562 RepID=UPI00403E6CE5